ncbi:MAG: hypothetical protein JWM93_1990 [Frankiales bacterium]|nr:hypothetical protein [Frankiales bacterium]
MRVFTRRAARAVAIAAGLTVPVAGALTAFGVDDGEVPDPLPPGQVVLIFVVLPLAISAIILLLTYLPSWFRAPRYRPTRQWDHDPLWFAGPKDAADAIAHDTQILVRGGGASAGW